MTPEREAEIRETMRDWPQQFPGSWQGLIYSEDIRDVLDALDEARVEIATLRRAIEAAREE